MHHRIAARKRRPQRLGIGQIAHMRLTANAFKIFKVAALADEETKVCAFRRERLSYMMAYKTRRTGKEYSHGEPLFYWLDRLTFSAAANNVLHEYQAPYQT
jgi:hypothetical protein